MYLYIDLCNQMSHEQQNDTFVSTFVNILGIIKMVISVIIQQRRNICVGEVMQ